MKPGWVKLKRWKARMPVWANPQRVEEVSVTTLAKDARQARRLAEEAGFKFDGPVTKEDEHEPG